MYNGLSIILGKPKSGKTHLIKYLVREICNHHGIEIVLLFSKSSGTPQYNYIPRQWQYSGFDTEKLNQIYSMQRALQQEGFIPPKILLIFDDCIDKKNQTQLFLDMVNNHRHLNFTVLYTLQFLSNNISTNFREVVNRAFVFKQDSANSLKSARDAFAPWLPQREFDNFVFNLNQYESLLIDKDEMTCSIVKAPSTIKNYSIAYRDEISPQPAQDSLSELN